MIDLIMKKIEKLREIGFEVMLFIMTFKGKEDYLYRVVIDERLTVASTNPTEIHNSLDKFWMENRKDIA